MVEKTVSKNKKTKYILIALIVVGILFLAMSIASMIYDGSCASQSYETIAEFQDLTKRWIDVLDIAESTPRISLGPQIAELQSIRRETANVEAPTCAIEAQAKLVASMDMTIDAFLAFLGNEPDDVMTSKLDAATILFQDYIDMVSNMK